MGVITKIKGTIESDFAIGVDPVTGSSFILSAPFAGAAQFRNATDSDYVPLRIKDSPADADSAMTRGAITSLVGGTDSIKWIQVPFTNGGGAVGNNDTVSTASMPNGSFILEARVLLSTVYNTAGNKIEVGYTGAGTTEIFTGADVSLDTGIATAGDVTTEQFVEVLPGTGPYNVHVRITDTGATAGDGVVLVGYVEAPLS